jgi:outer membrane protein W
MRARSVGWMVGTIAASAAMSAVALGQGSTWGGGAKAVPSESPPDGGTTDAAPGSIDAALDTRSDAARSAVADAGSDAATTADDAGEGEGGSFEPSVLGFGVGIRGSYGVPVGMANGSSLYDIVQGEVAIQGEAGWFFTPHLYLGAYFLYGFGVGTVQNDQCTGLDQECSANLIRFGLAVHWHFKPDNWLDPWVGLGLGYEILNVTQTDDVDGSSSLSSALQGVDATLEAGLDFKPLRYMGLGPYVELATGPYLGTDNFGMHAWVSMGARFRTNL